jgi:hypothetical protein
MSAVMALAVVGSGPCASLTLCFAFHLAPGVVHRLDPAVVSSARIVALVSHLVNDAVTATAYSHARFVKSALILASAPAFVGGDGTAVGPVASNLGCKEDVGL